MYSNLNLYYLNQMGIRPWIKRTEVLEDRVKLFVFSPSNLSIKATTLLNQMIKYIHLDSHELILIPVQDSGSLSHYKHQIDQKKPSAILVIGIIPAQLNLNCPVVTCDSPDDLLQHPAHKKKVFKELSYLNQIIAA